MTPSEFFRSVFIRSVRNRKLSQLPLRMLQNFERYEDRITPTTAGIDDLLAMPRSPSGAPAYLRPTQFRALDVDVNVVAAELAAAPHESDLSASPFVFELPRPNGGTQRFEIVESPIMAPELQAQFPDIRTYRGSSPDDPTASIWMDVSPYGFHAQVLSASGSWYIDPYYHNETDVHIAYNRKDTPNPHGGGCNCLLCQGAVGELRGGGNGGSDGGNNLTANRTGTQLRTYRTAVAATGEYTQFHGGTVAAGQAAVVTAMNRVRGVYTTELSISFQLVPNNSSLIFTDPATDPYSNFNGGAMLGQNQTTVDAIIGNSKYDIGHVFSTGGGGVALLGSVGINSIKAGGVTGLPTPIGDAFTIDFVAHEIGHQFGGTHTFNTSSDPNRTASTAFEPGSGTTIMAYAGITGPNSDLQPNSDPFFHFASFDQIIAHVDTVIPNVGTRTPTGNLAPIVSAGPTTFVIPTQTPFVLTASGSDPNGDAITYLWEQRDLGPAQLLNAPDNGTSPLFRSFPATTDPSRTFPRISDLVNNVNTIPIGEKLPTVDRAAMRFRVTARDNRATGGGVNTADTQVRVVNTGAAFTVLSPNVSSVNWMGRSTQTISWNVAGTNAAPINTSFVDISLSTDGGFTYPISLAKGVANNGSADIAVPNISTSKARVRVQGANNIFFDISNANFTITQVPGPNILSITPPPDKTYTTNNVLTFGVNYDIPIAVTGTPSLAFDVGGITKEAKFVSIANSKTATFAYTVATGDNDNNGIAISSPILLNGGTIASLLGDEASLAFTPPTTPNVLVDAVAPTLLSFTRLAPTTSKTSATSVTFRATFSEPVTKISTADFAVNGGSTAIVAAVTGSGSLYDITVNGGNIATYSGKLGLDLATTQGIVDLIDLRLATVEPPIDEFYTIDQTPPTVDIVDVTPDPRLTGVAKIDITFSEAVVGFDLGDLKLTNNGKAVALTGVTLSGNDASYTISGLTALTSDYGNYVLTLTAAGSGIADIGGVPLALDASDSWTKALLATFTPITPSPRNTAVDKVEVTFPDVVTGFDPADLKLTLDGGIVAVAGLTITNTKNVYTIVGLAPFTAAAGEYEITIVAAGSGIAANTVPLFQDASTKWFVDLTPPAAPNITGISNDFGNSATDSITSDNTITISGTAVPNSPVEVYLDLTLLGTTTSDASGVWNFDNTANTIPDGSYILTAITKDIAGNSSAKSANFSIVIDTTPPNLTLNSITTDSNIATDFITNDNTLIISGTAEPDSLILVRLVNTPIGTVVTNAMGQWSVDATSMIIADGKYSLRVQATDIAGNSPNVTRDLVIDTVALAPVISKITTDTGRSGNDNITSDRTLVISGTAEPLASVKLARNGSLLATVTADATGAWFFDDTATSLADGTYTFTAIQTDVAGNISNPSADFLVTVDAIAPLNPTVTSISTDSKIVGDAITNDKTLIFNGSAEANASVEVYLNGNLIGTSTANTVGNWSFDHTGVTLADGTYLVTTKAIDAAGNASVISPSFTVVINTVTPPAPTIETLTPDSGTNGDRVTNNPSITLNGTAEANSEVEIFRDGLSIGKVTASAGGAWSLAVPSPLADGSYTFTANATNIAGNTSPLSSNFSVVIDTIAPAAPIITLISPDSNITTDGVTKFPQFNVRGTAEPNSLVAVTIGGTQIGTIKADAAGDWSLNPNISFADGPYSITATSQDLAANTSPTSVPFVAIVDTVAPAPPVVASLTNVPTSDGITNTNKFVITGTAEPNSTVSVFRNTIFTGTFIGTTTTNAMGVWSLDTTATPLIDGFYFFGANATDLADNQSAFSNKFLVTVDTLAPVAPLVKTITTQAGAITGGITNDNTVLIVGTAEAGAFVTVFDKGTPLGQTVADAKGDWTFDYTGVNLLDGAHTFTATATDAAKNVSPVSGELNILVDTVAPNAPSILGITPDSKIDGDGVTNVRALTIRGVAEPLAKVEIRRNGTSLGSTTADAQGAWTFNSAPAPFAEGSSVLLANATDSATNVSSNSSGFTVVVDTKAPAAPTITGVLDDTGKSVTDSVTKDNTLAVTGTAEANSFVSLFRAGTLVGTTQADSAGLWTVDLTAQGPITDGATSFTAKATDLAGNTGNESASFAVSIDTVSPTQPVITGITPDTANPNDFITNTLSISVNGTAEPNSFITLRQGNTVLAAVTNANGTWTAKFTAPLDGNFLVTAQAQDLAGNDSPVSQTKTIVIDTVAPTPATLKLDVTGSTSNRTPIVTINGEPNVGVTVLVDGNAVATGQLDTQGVGVITNIPALSDGPHTFSVVATDLSGNSSNSSNTATIIVDTVVPAVPQIISILPDTGVPNDRTTNIAGIRLVGTSEAKGTVEISREGVVVGTAPVDDSGAWDFYVFGFALTEEGKLKVVTVDASAGNFGVGLELSGLLTEGTTNFKAVAIDSAANRSTPTANFAVTLDTTPPVLGTTPFVLQENLPAGTVVGKLTLSDAGSGIDPISLVSGVGDAGNSQFRIEGDRLVASSVFDFEATKQTSVRVRVGDRAGNITEQVIPIQIGDVDDTPVVPPVVPTRFVLAGSDFGTQTRVIAIDSRGQQAFTVDPFGRGFTAGVRTAAADFTGDGIDDFVFGTGPGVVSQVRVIDGNTQAELFRLQPFESSFVGGVYVAAGDIDGDGKAELAITPDEGGGPRVDVYRGNNFTRMASFLGIDDKNFRGGARSTIGDVDGDGRGDLIVSAGFGGGPRIAGYKGASLTTGGRDRLFNDFFAFEESLRNGAFVAVGDVNGDGKADLLFGGGPGGGPRVLGFDGSAIAESLGENRRVIANFFSGDTASRNGVRVAVKDVNADGKDDLTVGLPGGSTLSYLGRDLTPNGVPPEFRELDLPDEFTNGVYVG